MNKPVFILIHGFSSSSIWWQYKDIQTSKLKELTFLNELKKMGDVYEFTIDFFNILYYYTIKDEKERERMRIIYKNYQPHTAKLDFKIKDLQYKNICKKIHHNVMKQFGENRTYIPVCHSYGCLLGLLYSKMYKNECLFNVMIDSPPNYLELFTQQLNSKQSQKEKITINKYLHDDLQLKNMLNKIKTKITNNALSDDVNVNKEIMMIFDLISYIDSNERIKYYDKEFPIYTLWFRATYPNATNSFKIKQNKWGLKEKEIIDANNNPNNFKYITMSNAEHYIWFKQKYSDEIIDEIKKTLRTLI